MFKTWFQAIIRWLVAISIAATLAACGGGGGGGDPLPSADPVSSFQPSKATPTEWTIDNRKVVLSVPVAATAPSTAEKENLFKWAEKWDKETGKTFFPAGPTTQEGIFDGKHFVYRVYPTGVSGASIRIRDDGAVFVHWPDGTLRQHGWLARDYFCQINDCLAPATAGTWDFAQDESGTRVEVKPNLKGNLITALGAKVDGVPTGFEIPAEDVDELCWFSNRMSNWSQRGVIGCNRPQTDGRWIIKRVPSNDHCGQVVAWTKSGQLLWLDHIAARGWKVTGMNAVAETCGVSYGAKGYTPAVTYAIRESDGTATLVWDFGYHADFVAGVDGKLIDLGSQAVTYAFALNGNRQGKDYGPGWGLGSNRKTPEGFLIAPSIRQAWLERDALTGNLILKFRGLACTDKVNITAYRGTGPRDHVIYDYGSDGFGLGWASVGGDAPYWSAGVGTLLISATSQIEYGVPFCTQK